MSKSKVLTWVLFAVLSFASCKKNNDAANAVTSLTVTPETITLSVNEVKQLTATIQPAGTTAAISWQSENASVAAVSSNGTVTARSKGSTAIIAKAGSIEKKITVIVKQDFTIAIGTTIYKADTLEYQEVSPGVKWIKFNIPEFINGFGTLGKGLVVSAIEVDLSNPDNKIETWAALPKAQHSRETPSALYKRKELEYASKGRKPVAAINGDFYLLSSENKTGYAYINSRPLGMEITNGMVTQSSSSWPHAFVVRDNGLPAYNNVSFSAQVDAGSKNYTLSEVNGYAASGELALFNNLSNSYATDSAFAWSPYTSTMVSLSYPEGGWRVNDRMVFTVTAINQNVETAIPAASPYKGKSFNGEGAILVGNGATTGTSSRAFLSTLSVGDKVGIKMDVKLNGNNIPDKYMHVMGYQAIILQGGSSINTWNEAHSRTAIGYSLDAKKFYMIVIDGRQQNYSAGTTTGQTGDILKALGAFTGFNLDGGGSSAIAINGAVKNKPSDGTERAVANGILISVKK